MKVTYEVEILDGLYCRVDRDKATCRFFWESEDGDTGCSLLNTTTFIEGDIGTVVKFPECPGRKTE